MILPFANVASAGDESPRSLLLTRIATALVLAPLVLASIYLLDKKQFALVAGGIFLLAAYEWAELTLGKRRGLRLGFLLVCAAIGVFVWSQPDMQVVGRYLLWAAIGCWAWAIVEVLRFTGVGLPDLAVRIRWVAMGIILLPAAWFSMVLIRNQQPHLLVAVCLLVWGADVGAYFAGRAFGRTKLAPQVSPGKTWEGVLGGLLTGAITSAGFVAATLGFTQLSPLAWLATLGLLLLLVGVSVFGDLFESVLKRTAGSKDSGVLLPGHGGLLDRVDALVAVLPCAALLLWAFC
jgi:phosphatidate cytidylyltransferase